MQAVITGGISNRYDTDQYGFYNFLCHKSLKGPVKLHKISMCCFITKRVKQGYHFHLTHLILENSQWLMWLIGNKEYYYRSIEIFDSDRRL